MKLTLETKVLANALHTAAVAVETKTTLPILGNVKLEASKKELMISATNLDVYVVIRVPAKVKTPGGTTVPFRFLSSLVGQIKSKETSFEGREKDMEIRAGTIDARLETLPVDEFPAPLKGDLPGGVKCDAKDFMTPFRMCAHAMSTDETRYHLQGVNVAPGVNKRSGSDFAATNGSRMAIYYSPIKFSQADVIVPQAVIHAMLKIQPTGEAVVAIGNGIIAITVADFELHAKLIEGVYPNYRAPIPEKQPSMFVCERAELIHALTTCAVFTDKAIQTITLTGKGKEIEVTRPPKARAMVMGSELSGQPEISINLQARYALDALNVLEGDEVKIECTDEKTPLTIREGEFLAVLAPMVKPAQG